MSLKRRPTDPFKTVFIHDDALDVLPDKLLRDWADSDRDFDVIEAAVKAMEPKPTVFVCDPLKPMYDALAVTGLVSDIKAIFAAHVRDIQGLDDEDLRPVFEVKGDRKYLSMEYVDKLPLSVISDIGGAIIGKGMGNVSPFTLPAGLWQARARRHVKRHAVKVSTPVPSAEIASE